MHSLRPCFDMGAFFISFYISLLALLLVLRKHLRNVYVDSTVDSTVDSALSRDCRVTRHTIVRRYVNDSSTYRKDRPINRRFSVVNRSKLYTLPERKALKNVNVRLCAFMSI